LQRCFLGFSVAATVDVADAGHVIAVLAPTGFRTPAGVCFERMRRYRQNIAAPAFACPSRVPSGQWRNVRAAQNGQASKGTSHEILGRPSTRAFSAFRHLQKGITLTALVSRRNHD
jgi:hypothetical protein